MKRNQLDESSVATPSTSGEGARTRRQRQMGGSPTAPLSVKTESGSETNEQRMTRKLTRSQCPSGPPSATPSFTGDDATDAKATPKRSKLSKNRKAGGGAPGQTVELYRTDFITDMKMKDNDPLAVTENMLSIEDSWRQEWNRGVQVPVSTEAKGNPEWRSLHADEHVKPPPPAGCDKFKMPSSKYICLSKTGNQSSNIYYRADWHKVVQTAKQAESICPYDMDDMDTHWLKSFNQQRHSGSPTISATDFERVMECLENECAERIDCAIMQPGSTSVGREYDVDSVCDVCMSPNQEDDDCIVFCDGCDLCVHQSCYGIAELPSGQWFCRVCTLVGGRLPVCELCPNRGGAMKCTQSGERWAHISCVLWIPEVRFGDPELLEPVMHLRSVPEDRWLLRCTLCDKREGACIQCDVKSCRMAYHVTCAQRKSLEMKSVTQSNGQLKLLSYCARHSRHQSGGGGLFDHQPASPQKGGGGTVKRASGRSARSSTPPSTSANQMLLDSPRKRKARRVQTMYCRFYQFVSSEACAQRLNLDGNAVVAPIFEYWKLKRRRNNNAPLLTSREDEAEMLERQEEEALVRRVRTLIAMRQNLEKARNLCYMIERREKTKKSYVDCVGVTCAEMAAIVDDDKCLISRREAASLTSNYMRPLAGFDECVFPRVTDEHVEEQVNEWIRTTGGIKLEAATASTSSAGMPAPSANTSTSSILDSSPPKLKSQQDINIGGSGRGRRSSSRQSTRSRTHDSSNEFIASPVPVDSPNKAESIRKADNFWYKQSQHNINNRIVNGRLHATNEDEDVNVDGDTSSVASDDSGIHSSVNGSREGYPAGVSRKHEPTTFGGAIKSTSEYVSWYNNAGQHNNNTAHQSLTAARRFINAQQQRQRQLALAANNSRLRSPPSRTIVRAVTQPYRGQSGTSATVTLLRSPPRTSTADTTFTASERVRRRYPIVTTRRSVYDGSSGTVVSSSPSSISASGSPLSTRSSVTPRLLTAAASPPGTQPRFTVSMRSPPYTQDGNHPHQQVLKRMAPQPWSSDAKRARLSPTVSSNQPGRRPGSLPSRTPIVVLNQSPTHDRRATRSNVVAADVYEFTS